MKTITLHKPVNSTSVYNHLQQNINRLFYKHRQTDLHFLVEQKNDVVEVSQPELYEGILYHIEISNDELQITRSEHYVDDVNSLALESVMNELFADLSGKLGTDLVQEG